MYRRLTPLSTIARRLGLMKLYGVSERVSRNAIAYALRGYFGGCGVESYEGLVTDVEELDRIARGYHAQTGRRLRRQKIGICGQSKEDQRKAVAAAVQALGRTMFTKKETECALKLCTAPRFCYECGPHRGQPKLELVAQELNKRFHKGQSVRTRAQRQLRARPCQGAAINEVLPLPPPIAENPSRHHESKEADQEGLGHHGLPEALSMVDEHETEDEAGCWL